MREMTEAMARFFWAMSMFSAQQMLSVTSMAGKKDGADGRAACDAVSGAMEGRLGETLGEALRTGDRLQRSIIDMMFDLARWPGGGLFGKTGERSDGSTSAGCTGCADESRSPTPESGWGPMPPHG